MTTFFTALIADRPNLAGVLLVVVAFARLLYGMGYRADIQARRPPFLLAQFAGSIGIGYAMLVALSSVGVGPFVHTEEMDE